MKVSSLIHDVTLHLFMEYLKSLNDLLMINNCLYSLFVKYFYNPCTRKELIKQTRF